MLRGRVIEHFLGDPGSHMYCGPREKTVLLGCTCGDAGCWPLMARIEVTATEVRWNDFEQPHRREWSHAGLGPLAFSREHYMRELDEAATSAPP
jgi:hypothetical protein